MSKKTVKKNLMLVYFNGRINKNQSLVTKEFIVNLVNGHLEGVYSANYQRPLVYVDWLTSFYPPKPCSIRIKNNYINLTHLKDGLYSFLYINKDVKLYRRAILCEPTERELDILDCDLKIVIFTINPFCVPKDKIKEFCESVMERYNITALILKYNCEQYRYFVCYKTEDGAIKLFENGSETNVIRLIHTQYFTAKNVFIKERNKLAGRHKSECTKAMSLFEPYKKHYEVFKNSILLISDKSTHDLTFSGKKDIWDSFTLKKGFSLFGKKAPRVRFYGCEKSIPENVFLISNMALFMKSFLQKKTTDQKFLFLPAETNWLGCPNVISYISVPKKQFIETPLRQTGLIRSNFYMSNSIYVNNEGYLILASDVNFFKNILKYIVITYGKMQKEFGDEEELKIVIDKLNERYLKKDINKESSFEKIFPAPLLNKFVKFIKLKYNDSVLLYGSNSSALVSLFKDLKESGDIFVYDSKSPTLERKNIDHKTVLTRFYKANFSHIVLFNLFDVEYFSNEQFFDFMVMLHESLKLEGKIYFDVIYTESNTPYMKYILPGTNDSVEIINNEFRSCLISEINGERKIFDKTFITNSKIEAISKYFDIQKHILSPFSAIFVLTKKFIALADKRSSKNKKGGIENV